MNKIEYSSVWSYRRIQMISCLLSSCNTTVSWSCISGIKYSHNVECNVTGLWPGKMGQAFEQARKWIRIHFSTVCLHWWRPVSWQWSRPRHHYVVRMSLKVDANKNYSSIELKIFIFKHQWASWTSMVYARGAHHRDFLRVLRLHGSDIFTCLCNHAGKGCRDVHWI